MAAAPELIPELEPAAEVVVKEALPTLLLLCGLAVALGTIALVDYLARIWFGTVSGAVGWIPYVGKLITAPLHAIEQKITNLLGSWENAVDHRLGMSLHKLARIGDRLGRVLVEVALAVFIIGYLIATHLNPAHWRSQVTHIVTRVRTIVQRVTHVEHITRTISRTVHTILDRAIIPQIKAMQKAVTHTIPGWIRHVEADVTHAEHVAHSLEARLKHLEHEVTGPAFVALVATAIATLGATYIRCEPNQDVGKELCRQGPAAGKRAARYLRDLFKFGATFALAGLAVLDPEAIARAAVAACDVVEPVLDKMLPLPKAVPPNTGSGSGSTPL